MLRFITFTTQVLECSWCNVYHAGVGMFMELCHTDVEVHNVYHAGVGMFMV